MISPHAVRSRDQEIDSNPLDSKGYENVLLHQRIRSLILAEYNEESKEAFNSNTPTLDTERSEEAKAEYKCKRIAIGDQESKEAVDVRKGIDFAYLADRKPKATRTGCDLNQERVRIYTEGKEFHRDRTSSFVDSSLPTPRRIRNRCRPLSQAGLVSNQVKILNYRKLIKQLEARRIRRQSQRLAADSGSELPMDINSKQLENVEERNQQDDVCFPNAVITHASSQEEIDELRKRVRENLLMIRHRINTSQALLAERHVGSAYDSEEMEKRKRPENDGTEYRKTSRVPEVLPSISQIVSKYINTSSADNNANDDVARRTNQEVNQPKEIQKKVYPEILPAAKVPTKSTTFDPFSLEGEDAVCSVSDLNPNIMMTKDKSLDVSNDESRSGGTASINGEAGSFHPIKEIKTKKSSSDESLRRKFNFVKELSAVPKSLICSNNRQESLDKDSGQRSLTTVDSSSCASPDTLTSHESRIGNKSDEGSKKMGKVRRSFISSLSRTKAPNKEWLRTSIGPESDLIRKRDREMNEWLNAGTISGADIAQESARGGTMKLVFYDTLQKNSMDQ